MEAFGRLHPAIVHLPIALLLFSALFALLGRLLDRDWVRKASVLLLVFGFLGAALAMRSGAEAERAAEQHQGVPQQAIDAHGGLGRVTVYASGLAVVAFAAAARLAGSAAAIVSTIALLLQIAAGVLVGFTGWRGGQLVFDHGARVSIGGQLVHDAPTPARLQSEEREGGPPDTSSTVRSEEPPGEPGRR